MEESTMNNIHATTLRTNSDRVEARMEAAAAIWFANEVARPDPSFGIHRAWTAMVTF
jgi:hypothetical protein